MYQQTAHTAADDGADELRISILNALGASLAAKRRDAMAARAASGIENEWEGDEAFYQGYDAANRHEFVNTASKPTESGQSTPVEKTTGSIVFPNITQPYVDAVSARVGDMLLPTDEANYSIDPTPIPEMAQQDVAEPIAPPQPVQAPAPGAPPQPAQPPALSQVDQAAADVKKLMADATRRAEKGETRITDWLTECQYNSEMRKVIDDAAKLGTGCIKGPVPVKRKAQVWQTGEDGESALVVVEEIKPASMRIDPWNLYPDFPACGENIHNGSFVFEYDQISERKLEDLKGLPGYIDSQIDVCLEQGPMEGGDATQRTDTQQRSSKTLFGIWYYHGIIKADEMLAAGCDCGDSDSKTFPAILTMVNDRVIRAALNPLDNGEFPYDMIPWKRRPGMPWGMGLARQMRTPQRIVVAATRKLMDNAGLASGPQIVVRRGVTPENGIWEITPLKVWIEEDSASGNATAPVTSVVIPMLQVDLMNIIQLGMKMAEDVTGMPALMQGQQGAAPDTVGGMNILNNNANSVLRRIARLFDSCITEPHIRRYYTWLMEYGEDDSEKGDFQVQARGSTALVERDIQSQEMVQVLQLCLNPAYGKSPEKAMNEYLKSRRFDPAAFDYTEEQKAKMQAQQPPPAPAVQVAQIRAETDLKKAEMGSKTTLQKTQIEAEVDIHRSDVDTDRDTAFIQAAAEKNANDAALRMEELNLKREIELLRYTTQQKISLEDAKVQLARDTMKLNTQKELAAAAGALNGKGYTVPQVATPAFEPPGRAPDGEAFQK
jgi:hypothetical protein